MTIFQDSSLRPDLRERAKVNDVPVARLIGFEAAQIGEGRATVTLAAGPQHANPMGTLHGGILCDIADAAMGMSFAMAPDESFTTIELKMNFFRPVWQAQLKAEGTVVQRGRTIGEVLLCSGRAPRGRNYFGNSTGSSENETSQDIAERSLVPWHGLAAQV